MNILLADDDTVAMTVLVSMLNKEGFQCVCEENGLAALDRLLEPDAPSIAIIDWKMPGLDGIDVIKELRQKSSSYIYCILLTAKSTHEDVETGFAAGADDFLVKPANSTYLIQKLHVAKRIMQYESNEKMLREELAKYAHSMKELAEQRARQLIHADRLATIGTLSAGVAHEINNPATFISGNIQTIEKCWNIVNEKLWPADVQDPQLSFIHTEFPKMVSGIRSGIKRITRIVSSLKNYARRDVTLTKTAFSMYDVICESLEICTNKLKYTITVVNNSDSSLPLVHGDKNQIEQVLINLITNAADAMNGVSNATLTIETNASDNYLWVSIQDSGPGIDENVAEKIFDPFFTTKSRNNGTGLGLSISRSIVEAHNGELLLGNTHPGTCFRFSIPVAQEQTNKEPVC